MKQTSKPSPNTGIARKLLIPLLLALFLAVFFWQSYQPGYVHFSNDGPLGVQNSTWFSMPHGLFGQWYDLNSIGVNSGAASLGVTSLIREFFGPLGLAKFYPLLALLILGLGAYAFFRVLKLSLFSAGLGAFAIVLNSTFFGGATWGVASVEIAMGFNFLALAFISANNADTPAKIHWIRIALAGFCVGVNVMEGADIGATCSMFIALFAFYKSLIETTDSARLRLGRAMGRVATLAICAGLIAIQTVLSFEGAQVKNVNTGQSEQAHWDYATQWSLPKTETLGLVVPGLFGYKMDTPNGMMPAFTNAFEGGVYWGGVGRDPANDRYFDSGGTNSPPDPSWMRQTGGGNYCGILVFLIALIAFAQALRGDKSPFTPVQRKMIWFWTAVMIIALLFAWGRFAPFYAVLYHLPYFSTIRNPTKFIFFVAWAMVVLFAYGLEGFRRNQLNPAATPAPLRGWWPKLNSFDRRWIIALAVTFGVSALAWVFYAGEEPALIKHLEIVGFGDPNLAKMIASFSINQASWFILLLAAVVLLLTFIIGGVLAGPRAIIGVVLLSTLFFFDLVRANLPYVIPVNYFSEYEINSLNPVESALTKASYEHRVAILPFDAQSQLRDYDNNFTEEYKILWAQRHFPYYNIQSLDIVQMPRMPADLQTYLSALTPHTVNELPLFARLWQLTNTRYILGAAGYLQTMNEQLDPGKNRFRIDTRFDLTAKTNVIEPSGFQDLTATLSPNGDLALFNFTGALPRASLYGNWQINTNDEQVLKTLADLKFDPTQTVLVSTPLAGLPSIATNANTGTVEYKSYRPWDIVLDAKSDKPSVLLLNDHYDPMWHVSVDGKSADLLRCNFIMRGVYLQPGDHTVEFKFYEPSKPLYVTLTSVAVAILLSVYLVWLTRRQTNS